MVFVLSVFFLWPAAGQQGDADARQVVQQLTDLLSKPSGRAEIGLAVADAESGQRWFAQKAEALLKPASVLKLFVTAAALQQFGPGFEYQTKAYLDGGELWVIGAGDPGLGDERLARRHDRPLDDLFDVWAAALRARGAASLDRIVLDDSVFDQEWRHPDWPADQASSWYQAPVGGLNYNDNCLDVRVERRGKSVRVSLRPDLPATFYENGLRAGKKHNPVARRANGRDVFEFLGSVSRDAELGPISVNQPSTFFGQALKQALAARGIEVRGEVVRAATVPESVRAGAPLAEARTPLGDVLWRCNTFSQNMFAECLIKSLAAYGRDGGRSGVAGSWAGGRERVQALLGELGVDVGGAVLRDGSGLSHDNRVSAKQITDLLVRMYHHEHKGAFIESLASPGEEGSMQRRFADRALIGRLRGKTGTIEGVHALAGYVTRADGTVLAFALLCNGTCDPSLPVSVAKTLAGPLAPR